MSRPDITEFELTDTPPVVRLPASIQIKDGLPYVRLPDEIVAVESGGYLVTRRWTLAGSDSPSGFRYHQGVSPTSEPS